MPSFRIRFQSRPALQVMTLFFGDYDRFGLFRMTSEHRCGAP